MSDERRTRLLALLHQDAPLATAMRVGFYDYSLMPWRSNFVHCKGCGERATSNLNFPHTTHCVYREIEARISEARSLLVEEPAESWHKHECKADNRRREDHDPCHCVCGAVTNDRGKTWERAGDPPPHDMDCGQIHIHVKGPWRHEGGKVYLTCCAYTCWCQPKVDTPQEPSPAQVEAVAKIVAGYGDQYFEWDDLRHYTPVELEERRAECRDEARKIYAALMRAGQAPQEAVTEEEITAAVSAYLAALAEVADSGRNITRADRRDFMREALEAGRARRAGADAI